MRATNPSIVVILLLLIACGGEKERWSEYEGNAQKFSVPEDGEYELMFYNTGGLFHPENDPDKDDDAYTPEGKYEWDEERYRGKLEQIAELLAMEEVSFPELVGICEIENARVLEDLVKKIEGADYGFLHHESRDPRGIDLGLLYDPEAFKPYRRTAHPVTNPGSSRPSRPILSIGLENAGGDSLRCFLAHWPSRAGGKEESEGDRMNASRVLQKQIEKLRRRAPQRKVLVMGDLNDHPDDKSVRELLQAFERGAWDLMAPLHQEGSGTYNYRGEWGVLDHFIIDAPLEEAPSGLRYKEGSARILEKEELLFYDEGAGSERPDRYMKGGNYFGGYSDHLPILMTLLEGK